jgi:PBSX family phage terminase large subunit
LIAPLEGKARRAVNPPADASVIAFDGAVRSSKTVASLLWWAGYVMTAPPGALLMAGRTERAVIDNLIYPLQEMMGRKRVRLNRGTGTVEIFGRHVLLIGANDEQARTKIQGLTLAGAYLDEAANVPESFFNMLRSRLSVKGAKLVLTCNPEGPKHWLLVNWFERARWWIDADGRDHFNPDGLPWFRVTFLLDDNTWLNRNNPEFVAELKASWPASSMWYKRYILSMWVAAEGAVYEMWDEAQMTLLRDDQPPIEQLLMVGVDYGTTHDTRAYLLGMTRVNVDHAGVAQWADTKHRGVDAQQSRTVLVVLDEYAPTSGTVGMHAAGFEDWYAKACDTYGQEPEWIATDSAAATFKVELLARGMTNVMGAFKSVVPGIQTVQSLLSGGRLYVVGDACPKLVRGIPGYMWDAKATDRGATAPIKKNDDEVDALRYAVYTSRRYWRDQIPLAPISVDESQDEEAA